MIGFSLKPFDSLLNKLDVKANRIILQKMWGSLLAIEGESGMIREAKVGSSRVKMHVFSTIFICSDYPWRIVLCNINTILKSERMNSAVIIIDA